MPMRGRIEKGAAEAFVRDWIAAWNDRDLDAVLEHYSEDVELHSPRIATVTGREEAFVSGKTALAAYWRKALEDAPELNFILERVYVGSDAISIAYRNHRGQHAVETLVFDEHGRVRFASVAYD